MPSAAQDGGTTWTKIDSQAARDDRGRHARLAPATVVLADQGGRLAVSHDGGMTFELIPAAAHRAAHLHHRCRRRSARG